MITITLKKALELAQSMKAAYRNTKSLKTPETLVQKVSGSSTPCYRCGRSNHNPKDCRFRDADCHFCKKKGHIASVCRAKQSLKFGGRARKTSGGKSLGPRPPSTKWVDAVEPEMGEDDLQLEIDTGASFSIISETQRNAVFPHVPMQKSTVPPLNTYTKEPIPILGQLNVDVRYGEQQGDLPLIVVGGDGPCLLGRNWLNHIRLDWREIFAIAVEEPENLEALLEKHSELFKEELGTISSLKASLQVQPNARPRFFKPRPVPFALKPLVEKELDCLEAAGILQKVDSSDWAAPIAPVPKKDGQLRICGDYKVTVNQALETEQYPLPKPEDLFATLAGGKKFTKLDLSHAYLQLPLDEKSRKYVTINTHRGLYEYTRLPFGISSAPATFQKVMDTILQGIPNVICYIDDILVTGADDQTHLRNLAEVLQRLEQHGIKLSKAKCSFMKPSVDYLGHRVDAEGLHTTADQVEALLKAPVPTNV